ERLERRDIKDPDALLPARRLPEVVERGQEGREGLTRARGGHDQGILPRRDRRPPHPLRRRRLPELLPEPRGHSQVEPLEHVGRTIVAPSHGREALGGPIRSLLLLCHSRRRLGLSQGFSYTFVYGRTPAAL